MAKKKRLRRRHQLDREQCSDRDQEHRFAPESYRLAFLLYLEEHKPKWLLPSHREEIAATIQIARQAGGGPEIADLLRTLAKLLVPGMLAEVMDDRLPQEESDPFFDPQRFCEALRIITLELLEAGVVLPPDDEFFEQ